MSRPLPASATPQPTLQRSQSTGRRALGNHRAARRVPTDCRLINRKVFPTTLNCNRENRTKRPAPPISHQGNGSCRGLLTVPYCPDHHCGRSRRPLMFREDYKRLLKIVRGLEECGGRLCCQVRLRRFGKANCEGGTDNSAESLATPFPPMRIPNAKRFADRTMF